MNKFFLLAITSLAILSTSCSKSSDDEELEPQGPVFTGNVTFYVQNTSM